MKLERITIDPKVCTGKPCIRNLRFPVSRLLGLLAAGESRESIIEAYPYIEQADIDETLRYAAYLAEDQTVEVRSEIPYRHASLASTHRVAQGTRPRRDSSD